MPTLPVVGSTESWLDAKVYSGLIKTSMVPGALALPSAMPIVCVEAVALAPTPGTLETVIVSPTAIGPQSMLTLTGTRPASATGLLFGISLPSKRPGAVETTPKYDAAAPLPARPPRAAGG